MNEQQSESKVQQLGDKERRAIAGVCGSIIARKWQENPLVTKVLAHLKIKDVFKFKTFFAG